MVWSQYVYEATVDLDSYGSGDDDDAHEHTPLNIEDWEVEYSDELTFRTLKRIFLLRMRQKLCGVKHVTYQSHGNDPRPAGLSYDQIHEKESYRSWISSWSRFTRLSCMSCLYTTLETKRRQYNIEDALEL